MMLLRWLSCLLLALYAVDAHFIPSDEASEEQSTIPLEERLVNTRKALISRLDECTSWRDNIEDAKRTIMDKHLIKGHFQQFVDFSIKVTRELSRPDDEDCLRSTQFLIRKYKRILAVKKRYMGVSSGLHIEEFLSPRQINSLHAIYKKTGRREDIEIALERFFEGMSPERKSDLIKEFFSFKSDLRRRGPRHIPMPREEDDLIVEEVKKIPPEALQEEWLRWQTARNKLIVSRMEKSGADKWEIQNKIADQFYHLRKMKRLPYEEHMKKYCIKNLKEVLGEDKLRIMENLYLDNVPLDQIETRFQEIVSELPNESKRQIADNYGTFCRKIFRLVQFQPADLTGWLTGRQKVLLGEMIQDQEIGDQLVYEKVFEFFQAAEGEQKEEARETIDTGCRHFITHMFGDDTAEEIEDLRLAGNISTQILAARLAKHAKEISSERLRKRAEQSLPICTRIYLDYNGSCQCYNHSSICDPHTFICKNCSDNTHGVQCHRCLEGFTGDPRIEACYAIDAEVPQCQCNGHSNECDASGVCQNCQHNSEGDNCEKCKSGFFAVASTTGDDVECTACPCPNNGTCFVNESELVQCTSCPDGYKGITCDETFEPDQSNESREDSREEKKTF